MNEITCDDAGILNILNKDVDNEVDVGDVECRTHIVELPPNVSTENHENKSINSDLYEKSENDLQLDPDIDKSKVTCSSVPLTSGEDMAMEIEKLKVELQSKAFQCNVWKRRSFQLGAEVFLCAMAHF